MLNTYKVNLGQSDTGNRMNQPSQCLSFLASFLISLLDFAVYCFNSPPRSVNEFQVLFPVIPDREKNDTAKICMHLHAGMADKLDYV
jgi:hypothetical protein